MQDPDVLLVPEVEGSKGSNRKEGNPATFEELKSKACTDWFWGLQIVCTLGNMYVL